MNTAIPWGYPAQQPLTNLEAFLKQYGVWVAIGGLALLMYVSSGGGRKY